MRWSELSDTPRKENYSNNQIKINMKELFNNIQAKLIEFNHELNLNVNNGNKAAGTRARKASLELEKLFKEYRKRSVEANKA